MERRIVAAPRSEQNDYGWRRKPRAWRPNDDDDDDWPLVVFVVFVGGGGGAGKPRVARGLVSVIERALASR